MILFSCYMKENVICLKIFVDNYFSSVYSETQDKMCIRDRDIVVLNDDYSVEMTYLKGKEAF